MNLAKTTQYGNAFVGLFARANDSVAFIPKNSSEKFLKACEQVLGVELVRVSVANSDFIGLITALNGNGMVLPNTVYEEEIRAVKKTGLNVCISKSKWCAFGNNLAANSKGCIASPRFNKYEVREIGDCLGVEVVQASIAGFQTVGSACVATDKGFIAHNDASDEELKFLESIFKVSGLNGTVNMGVSFVGIGVVANSNGCVVGEPTSGFELGRVSQALSLF